MSKNDISNDDLLCSFCGKSQDEVKKLIAGPSVYICDECIQLCNEIIAEEYNQEDEEDGPQLLKPVEIKETLDQYVIEQDKAKRSFPLRFTITINGSTPKWTWKGLRLKKAIFCSLGLRVQARPRRWHVCSM